MNALSFEDFARSFGTTTESLPDECRRVISENDFTYRVPQGEERDKIILEVLKKIDTDTQVIGAPERKEVWQKGWEENLHEFTASGNSLEALIPKFIRSGAPIRFGGNFIIPTNPMFELAFLRVFRIWLFKNYFSSLGSIYEFGCGTGFNLVELAGLFPQKEYFGLDFVPAAAALVDKIGEAYGWKMSGKIYDFRHPDRSFLLTENCGIFTFGAIEQVAGDFERFLDHILSQPVSLCANVEPTIELYDENCLFDYLAIRFHKKRGYTSNYLTRLKELEAQKRVQILKIKRLYFGSLYMEGYSLIIWRPLRAS